MMILMIKDIIITNGIKEIHLEKGKIYSINEVHAKGLIRQGYSCEFGFINMGVQDEV